MKKTFILTILASMILFNSCTTYPVAFRTNSIQNPILMSNIIRKELEISPDANNYAIVTGVVKYSKSETTDYTRGIRTIEEKKKANADIDFINNNINNNNLQNFGADLIIQITGYDILGVSNSCEIYYRANAYTINKGEK